MQLELNGVKIRGYATVGEIPDGVEIDESILPSNFFTEWYSEKFLYIDGVVSEDPDFVSPPVPEPKPTMEEKVAALTEQNQMLTDCILEMSEIIYGGD